MSKLNGRIIKIGEVEQISDSFKKREFVIETSEEYPQKVKFELTQVKTALIEDYEIGDLIDVEFNIRGNEWNGKYFVNLQAWKLTRLKVVQKKAESEMETTPTDSIDDDLPF